MTTHVHSTSRRGMLGILAAAPLVATAATFPALPRSQSAFRVAEARYHAASAHFNALPDHLESSDYPAYQREWERMLSAITAVETAPIADWGEFADAFRLACDDGTSVMARSVQDKLLADAARLAGRAEH